MRGGAQPWLKWLVLLGAFLALSYQVGKVISYYSRPGNDAEVKELQRIISEIAPFPDFRETNAYSRVNKDTPGFFKEYASNTPYIDVEQFYRRELAKRDWHLVEEENFSDWGTEGRTLTFRKNEFLITLTHKGGLKPGKYSISYYWWPEAR